MINNFSLIIDAGNSMIKIAIFNSASELIVVRAVYHQEYSSACLKDICKSYRVLNAYIGSVKPSIVKGLTKDIKDICLIEPIIITTSDFLKEFDLSSFDLWEVGVDILGFANFLKHTYPKAIGLCYGTCLFAIGVDHGKLLGAIIVPDLKDNISKMFDNVELITVDDIKYNDSLFSFGSKTETAISSGINHIYSGLPYSICSYFQSKNDFSTLCVTGGKKILFTSSFVGVDKFDIDMIENAVVKGYALLYLNKS